MRSIFQRARDEGFQLALHCGEINDAAEIREMIEFMTPEDRIGHGTFIDGDLLFYIVEPFYFKKLVPESDEATWTMFREKNIPVEICLTSNVMCNTAPSFEDHHITRLLQVKHPIVIGVSCALCLLNFD